MHGKVLIAQSCMMYWIGNPYLIGGVVLQIHKIVNTAPSYLKNKLPRFSRPLYSPDNINIYPCIYTLVHPLYSPGNINTFHGIRFKSDRYMNSFFPDGINSWNNVITHFKNIPSIEILKKHILLCLILPEKKKFLRYT